ncbi:hypothetical protein ACFWAP_20685 [Streptomyces goshikiensis]|uniref:hypothetical protein n=1 Tax=Streptomyces goshikiensis TaxID=1942 RepID=UPI00365107B1
MALDGFEDFLLTRLATPCAWPHEPAAVEFHATEGLAWCLTLAGAGARSTRIPASAATGSHPDAAGVRLHGTASDLLLFMYDRIPASFLRVDGDLLPLDRLRAWEPEEWAARRDRRPRPAPERRRAGTVPLLPLTPAEL